MVGPICSVWPKATSCLHLCNDCEGRCEVGKGYTLQGPSHFCSQILSGYGSLSLHVNFTTQIRGLTWMIGSLSPTNV